MSRMTEEENKDIPTESADLEGEGETRIYEVSYLFVPSLTEESADAEVEKIKAHVAKKGGDIIAEGRPRLIDLAYPMAKSVANKKTMYEKAFFGWTKFELDASAVSSVKELLDANDFVIRFLTIKTTRETLQIRPKEMKKDAPAPAAPAPKTEVKDEKQGPVNEEVLDKELEDLLVG